MNNPIMKLKLAEPYDTNVNKGLKYANKDEALKKFMLIDKGCAYAHPFLYNIDDSIIGIITGLDLSTKTVTVELLSRDNISDNAVIYFDFIANIGDDNLIYIDKVVKAFINT